MFVFLCQPALTNFITEIIATVHIEKKKLKALIQQTRK